MKYLIILFLFFLVKLANCRESAANNSNARKILSTKQSIKEDCKNDSINQELRELYLEIYFTDQHFRKHLYERNDSIISTKSMLALFRKNDSINAIRIMKLVRLNNGFPTTYEIGPNQLYFVIYHVSDYLDMDYILEEIRKVTLQGKIYKNYGPSLIDYIRKGNNLNQLYGTKTFINKKGQEEYRKIDDIKNVDKRRKTFLLAPLYEQAKIDNILLPKDYRRSK